MRIAVFGLGYVGTVCGTCLASHGHWVIGVDVQPSKVDRVNQAIAPVVEPGLQELLSAVVNSGNLKATTDSVEAMRDADVILLCVGTPSQAGGELNLTFLEAVVKEVAANLSVASKFPVVAIRSTVPPGTLAGMERIISESAHCIAGEAFGIVLNPEFLREGSALSDFENPPYTLIGTDHPRAVNVMKQMYAHLSTPFLTTSVGAAEIIKYVNNSFHALKITFANEIGRLCKAHGIDSHEVMDLVCLDTKLNISSVYLKPGFAYGGSCLPKDLAALNQAATHHGEHVPVLSHISESNAEHLAHSVRLVEKAGNNRIGILGLSFKAETDDLRESPAVVIVESLLSRGYSIRIYDPSVNMARLIGANLQYIDTRIESLAELLVSSTTELLEFAETVVVTNNDSTYQDVLSHVGDNQTVIDLTRLPDCPSISGERYHGICW